MLSQQFAQLATAAAQAGQPWKERIALRRTMRHHQRYARLSEETLAAVCELHRIAPTDILHLDLLQHALEEYVAIVERIRSTGQTPPRPAHMTPEYCRRMHDEVRAIVQTIKTNRAKKAAEKALQATLPASSSTKNIKPAESATASMPQSEDLVADPMTGKLILKSLHEATERLREADKTRDWRKRRVF